VLVVLKRSKYSPRSPRRISLNEFNVLIVCTGNTCRSPMAEGILKSVLSEKDIKNINVSSAGTAGFNGHPATGFAVEAAKVWNVDISGHLSTPLTKELLDSADLILAMSSNHIGFIKQVAPKALSRSFLLKGFPEPYSPLQEDVYDPIGGPLDLYNQTYMELDEKIRGIVPEIVKLSENASRGNS